MISYLETVSESYDHQARFGLAYVLPREMLEPCDIWMDHYLDNDMERGQS